MHFWPHLFPSCDLLKGSDRFNLFDGHLLLRPGMVDDESILGLSPIAMTRDREKKSI
jgi:hypothetical protein